MFRWLGSLRRPLFWATLALILFLTPFFIQGLTEGMFLTEFRDEARRNSIHYYHDNFKPLSYTYSLPAFRFVLRLRNPSSWWETLDMRRFDLEPGQPVDRYADLNRLFKRRKEGKELVEQKWHHWVYASAHQDLERDLATGGPFADPWDAAFDELLRYHYKTPAAIGPGERFHYIHCERSFLCNSWVTRGPALLHFTTESPDLWPHMDLRPDEEREPDGYYDNVAVRIIELPLKDMRDMALLPGTFPSPFEQMHSLTGDPHAWQRFPTYEILQQLLHRVEDISSVKAREYPKTYGLLTSFNGWLWEYTPEELEIVISIIPFVGLLTYILTDQAIEIGL